MHRMGLVDGGAWIHGQESMREAGRNFFHGDGQNGVVLVSCSFFVVPQQARAGKFNGPIWKIKRTHLE